MRKSIYQKKIDISEADKKKYQKQAYIWNTISSLLNAGMSALLLLVVSQVCGEEDAGIFTLAFSIAQLLVTIAYFEVRPYQVTDIVGKYSNNDYYNFKILTCTVMLIFSFFYIKAGNYDRNKSFLILFLCIFKMLDAFEDYYVALYQKNGRLDIGARKSAIRVLISMIVFCIVTIFSKNILLSITAAVVSSIVIIFIWFVWKENKKLGIYFNIYSYNILEIGLACFPMFLGSYLILYVGNAPKYAIDKYMEIQYQAYYGILYMPSFIINLFSGFVFKPMINDMARYYNEDRKKYRVMTCKMITILIIISLLVILGGYWVGTPFLSYLYGVNLKYYRMELVILLLGGAISALGVIVYYMIMIMRCQKWMLISYILTAIAAYFLSPGLVINYGIRGACFGFLLFNIIKTGIFIIILLIFSIFFKEKN